jgi:hypothetical protein
VSVILLHPWFIVFHREHSYRQQHLLGQSGKVCVASKHKMLQSFFFFFSMVVQHILDIWHVLVCVSSFFVSGYEEVAHSMIPKKF